MKITLVIFRISDHFPSSSWDFHLWFDIKCDWNPFSKILCFLRSPSSILHHLISGGLCSFYLIILTSFFSRRFHTFWGFFLVLISLAHSFVAKLCPQTSPILPLLKFLVFLWLWLIAHRPMSFFEKLSFSVEIWYLNYHISFLDSHDLFIDSIKFFVKEKVFCGGQIEESGSLLAGKCLSIPTSLMKNNHPKTLFNGGGGWKNHLIQSDKIEDIILQWS